VTDKAGFTESPYLFKTYRRQPVTFVRGKGPWLWDDRGKKYLDFFSGLAVCNLGHAHPAVAKAISRQAKTLLHTSNLYATEPQRELARELSTRTFGGRVFFANSGAEANEGAIKLARRYGSVTPGPEGPRHEIIVFDHAFHGRTLGALSATPQKKYQEGFGPLLPGFPAASFGDMASVKAQATAKTCAVLVEPIQGEGGVRLAPRDFFRDLADFCKVKGLLLIFDEVQTGMGRTGALFAYQNDGVIPRGVVPDVLTAAKGLARDRRPAPSGRSRHDFRRRRRAEPGGPRRLRRAFLRASGPCPAYRPPSPRGDQILAGRLALHPRGSRSRSHAGP
jgi:acetylornithine/succinyldiaminopimelate/putrescine aminotransferase